MQTADLLQLYNSATSAYERHFAEQRSNIRLKVGYQWEKISGGLSQLARAYNLPENQKVRITKNHIGRASKLIINSVLNACPGVSIFPENDSELQDIKDASLSRSVWKHIERQNGFKKMVNGWASDQFTCGEAYALVKFDAQGGDFLGYDAPTDPETGLMNPDDAYAVFTGKVEIERLFPFMVRTDPDAKEFEKCAWVTVDRLVRKSKLHKLYGKDERLKKIIEGTDKEEYRVFNSLSGNFSNTSMHVLVRETYFRPTPEWPKGYFFIWTEHGILEEGETLTFPIRQVTWDDADTTSRGLSPIRDVRHLQQEINRASSQAIRESLTLGYSTVLAPLGSKLQHTNIGNGMKAMYYRGGVAPNIIPGRNGEQYIEYIKGYQNEIYDILNIDLHAADKASQVSDINALLMRSMKDKQKFSLYSDKFESFLAEVCDLSLQYARAYLDEESVIKMIGSNETINIAEFKHNDNQAYRIKVEEVGTDIDSMFGKAQQLQQLLQYAGGNLTPQQIGVLIKNSPFLASDEITREFTIDSTQADNIILALDRGQEPFFSGNENHEYMLQRLDMRMKQGSFETLPDEVKMKYAEQMEMHRNASDEQKEAIRQANSELIPTGGALVSIPIYEYDDNGRAKRKKVSVEALNHLVDLLDKQGHFQAQQSMIPESQQAMMGQNIPQPEMPPQQNVPMQMEGPPPV